MRTILKPRNWSLSMQMILEIRCVLIAFTLCYNLLFIFCNLSLLSVWLPRKLGKRSNENSKFFVNYVFFFIKNFCVRF